MQLRHFHPVLEATALRDAPVKVLVANRSYVVFRDERGRPAALADACPHRGAPLSAGKVANGKIACPYHGWRFDRDGAGHCPSQPALACETAAYQVAEKYGHLWLAERGVPVESIPELGSPGFQFAGGVATVFPTSIELLMDNFAEDEHIPMVHQVFGWSIDQWDRVSFEAKNFADRTEVMYRGPQRDVPGLIQLLGLTKHDAFYNTWVTRFDPVHFAFKFRWLEPNSERERPTAIDLSVFMVPETATTTRHVTFIHTRLSPALERIRPVVDRVFRFFTQREVAADRAFVTLLPLDWEPRGSRLNRYDKPIVHNRKLLREVYWGVGRASEESA